MISLDYGIPTDKEGIQLRLGVARGFFKAEGIDLNIKVLFGGPEIAAAYDSGQLSVGELGTPPGITAMAQGYRFKIVASGVRKRAVQYFVARPDIQAWDELKGATAAALTIGSCSYWFMRFVLEKRGLNPDRDVKLVGLGARYPHVVDLFEQGEIDAAVLSEPNVSIGEARGSFKILQALTDAEFCPTMQWSIVVANDRFIRQENDLLHAVLRASKRSYDYCRDNPDDWAEFSAKWFGADVVTIKMANARERDQLCWDCTPDLAGIQEAVDLQVRLGALSHSLNARDLVDLRFLPDLRI